MLGRIIVIVIAFATHARGGVYDQDFASSAVGATNFSDGSRLFSTHMGSVAAVVDATYKELQLTASGVGLTHSAFMLPDLDPGTNIYAFSAKWNTSVYGAFPNAADGYSFNFGPLAGLNLASNVYQQESGYGTGITLSVNTFANPGFHVIVNGAPLLAVPFNTFTNWGFNNNRRHHFEVD